MRALRHLLEKVPGKANLNVYTDSMYVLQGMRKWASKSKRQQLRSNDKAEWNRIQQLLEWRQSVGGVLEVTHVKSHPLDREGNDLKVEHMSVEQKLNCAADQQAKEAGNLSRVKGPLFSPGEYNFTLHHKGNKVTGDTRKFLNKLQKEKHAVTWSEQPVRAKLVREMTKSGVDTKFVTECLRGKQGHKAQKLTARVLTGSLQTVSEWFRQDKETFGVETEGGVEEMNCFCCNKGKETTSHLFSECTSQSICEVMELSNRLTSPPPA